MSSTSRSLLLLAAGCAVETPGLGVELVVSPAPATVVDEAGVPWSIEAATLGVATLGLVPCDDGGPAGAADASVRVDAALDLLAEGPIATVPVPPGAWCAVRVVPRVIPGCDPPCAWSARLGPPDAVREVSGLGSAPPPIPLPDPLDVDRAHRYARIGLRADPGAWLADLGPTPSDDALAEAVGARLATTLVAEEIP